MENEKRRDLIDRQELIKAASKKLFGIGDNTHPYKAVEIVGKHFQELVDNAPAVDAVEVVHGRWLEKIDMVASYLADCEEIFYECSVCNSPNFGESPYCPNCGAKMDGERKDGE